MVGINTIQAATVFSYFMLIMHLRRIALLVIFGVIGRNKPPQPGRAPEDKFMKTGQVFTPATDVAYTKDVRANRVIGNDSENDIYFLILLLATVAFSENQNPDCIRTICYSSIYVSCRIVYAVTYVMALQPFRTIAFALGFACTLACNIDLAVTLSRRSN